MIKVRKLRKKKTVSLKRKVYVYNVREGYLKKALKLAYEYSNPLGEYEVILHHPNMEIKLYTDEPRVFDKVANLSYIGLG